MFNPQGGVWWQEVISRLRGGSELNAPATRTEYGPIHRALVLLV